MTDSAAPNLGAWRTAWRERGDNALLVRWQAGARHTRQRRAWYEREPWMLGHGIALSAAATYLLCVLLQDYFTVRDSAVGSRAFVLGLLQSGVNIAAWAGMLLSCAWLLGRVFTLAQFALGLLGQGHKGGPGLQDEALRSTVITPEQVVLAALLHAWRLIALPVLAMAACAAVVLGLALMQAQGLAPTPPGVALEAATAGVPQWWQALLIAALYCALTLLSAYAGALCLALLLIVLGRGLGPLAPGIGAVQVVLLQGGLAFIGVLALADSSFSAMLQYSGWAIPLLALALGSTLAWLAHHVRLFRATAVYLSLALTALNLVLIAISLGDGSEPPGGFESMQFAQMHLLCFGYVMPMESCIELGLALAKGAGFVLAAPQRLLGYILYILAQCLFAMILALVARDAVARQRRGQA